jgi:hypothetical protein
MTTKSIYEIFEEVEKAPTKKEKIEVLRKNRNYALRSVLKGSFDPNVEFVIERVPYYNPSDSPPGLGYTGLHQEIDRVYLFEKNNPKVDPNLSQDRKEKILIQMLEAMEKREAEILMNMLLKKQKVKGLTYNLVKEAFPDILP